jgi:hypothetical protein
MGVGGFDNHLLSGMAGLIAGAGTRSLIDGTDFGDNIRAALPGVIGQTLGNAAVDALKDSYTRARMERSSGGADGSDMPGSMGPRYIVQPDDEGIGSIGLTKGGLLAYVPTEPTTVDTLVVTAQPRSFWGDLFTGKWDHLGGDLRYDWQHFTTALSGGGDIRSAYRDFLNATLDFRRGWNTQAVLPRTTPTISPISSSPFVQDFDSRLGAGRYDQALAIGARSQRSLTNSGWENAGINANATALELKGVWDRTWAPFEAAGDTVIGRPYAAVSPGFDPRRAGDLMPSLVGGVILGPEMSIAPAENIVATEARGGVYVLRDTDGMVARSGRTNDLDRREAEHLRDPSLKDFDFEAVYRTDSYNEQRGLEQILHDTYQPPLNRIQPISSSNQNYDAYMEAARKYLGY